MSRLNASELPPRPDPRTGRPWPPHAPTYTGPSLSRDNDPEWDRRQLSASPPGQGPVLGWYRPSRRSSLLTAGGGLLLLIGVATVGLGLKWVSWWPGWLIVILAATGIYFSTRAGQCRAGAAWVARGQRWVKTYELVKVTCRTNNGNPELVLIDSDGRRVEMEISHLQGDRRVWDLVYNGILHSVIAGGAQTNGQLHTTLPLPYPQTDQPQAGGSPHPSENDSSDDRTAES